MDLRNNTMYSNRKHEFVKHLKDFGVVCADIPLFVQYQEKFVSEWTNQVTHLCNTTMNKYIHVTLNTLHY